MYIAIAVFLNKEENKEESMCCSKRSGKENSTRSVAVYLNVYDLTSVNGYTHWLGLGVYHSGVEGVLLKPYSVILNYGLLDRYREQIYL